MPFEPDNPGTTAPPEWFTDEAFWESFYDSLFPPVRFEQAPEEVEQIVELLDLQPGASVCDWACGPGRHSLAFARQGFATTGVDRTGYLLERAGEHAAREGVSVEWVQEDLRAFRREEAFDAAVNLYTSFGYFETEEENLEALRQILASLKPGGKLLIETAPKEWIARQFLEASAHRQGEDAIIFEFRRFVDECTRLENTWTLLRNQRARTFQMTHFLYSGAELRRLLYDAGFAAVVLCGSLEGEPFDFDSQRLVAIARKAEQA